MLFTALNSIKEEFNDYLSRLGRTTHKVVLGNIALQDSTPPSGGTDVSDDLVLTLINVENEITLKNEPNISRLGSDTATQNPPLFLNLYILFSANINDYDEALKFLSLVLQFFQQNTTFSGQNHPKLAQIGIQKLSFEIFDLSFEQTNNLWAVLGSKLIPSVLYKVRMIAIQASPKVETRIIEQIIVTDNSILG